VFEAKAIEDVSEVRGSLARRRRSRQPGGVVFQQGVPENLLESGEHVHDRRLSDRPGVRAQGSSRS
jgi:hypothetical protein